jgi:hypothetical protein
MGIRPRLDEITDIKALEEYYYLLAELKTFCRQNGISAAGGKREITQRIAHYIDKGEVIKPKPKPQKTGRADEIEMSSIIEPNIKCSELHRAFFKEQIGKGFTFNVAFQNWLKHNSGRIYAEAVEEYRALKAKSKGEKTVISGQFEYNTYIRDFFADNAGRPLDDAILCWKYKKSIPEHNRYEKADVDKAMSLSHKNTHRTDNK